MIYVGKSMMAHDGFIPQFGHKYDSETLLHNPAK